MLIYLNTKSVVRTSIVLLAVPFSLVGAFWFLYLLGYNMSVAVWVGLIALAGLDAETGVVMLLYLDQAWDKFRAAGRMNSMADLLRCRHRRRGAAHPAQNHDHLRHPVRFAAHHVVARHPIRRGRDETHRRADDRRRPYVRHSATIVVSGHLRFVAQTTFENLPVAQESV